MEKITLKRTGLRPLSFTGELVTGFETSPDRAAGSYWSGATGRWYEVNLYRTAKGRYVVQVSHYTQWQGEQDEYLARVFDSLEEALTWEAIPPRALEEITEELGITEEVE